MSNLLRKQFYDMVSRVFPSTSDNRYVPVHPTITSSSEPLVFAYDEVIDNNDVKIPGKLNTWPSDKTMRNELMDELFAVFNIQDHDRFYDELPRWYSNDFSKRIIMQVDTIPPNTKYIYPVILQGNQVFFSSRYLNTHGSIPDRVVSDCQAGNCIVVFYDIFESLDSFQQVLAKRVCSIYSLPSEALIFVNNNMLLPAQLKKQGLTGFATNFFETQLYINDTILKYISKLTDNVIEQQPYNIVHFNRICKPHRIATVVGIETLFNQREKDNILYTLLDNKQLVEQVANLFPLLRIPNKFYEPDKLQYDYGVEVNAVHVSETMYHGYIQFINETTFGNSNLFLTEKTFKVLAAGLPFILNGNPGSLQRLHSLGYKTFHPYIDESYDTEYNDARRLTMVLAEVQRMARMSNEEARQLALSLRDICIHNHNLYTNRSATEATFQELEKTISRHLHRNNEIKAYIDIQSMEHEGVTRDEVEQRVTYWIQNTGSYFLIAFLNECPSDIVMQNINTVLDVIHNQIKKHCFPDLINNVVVVVNNQTDTSVFSDIGITRIHQINWFEYICFLRMEKHNQQVNHSWQPSSRGLFKVGKLRPHRLCVLHTLVSSKKIENCSIAFKLPAIGTEVYKPIQQAHLDILGSSDIEYLREYESDIDVPLTHHINQNRGGDVIHYGFPFDETPYRKTGYSIVCETHHGSTCFLNPWLTEKIFLPIMNHHPFIVFGESNFQEFLEECGYKTFDEFMPSMQYVKDHWFDTNQFDEQVRSHIVSAITELEQAISTNPEKINDVVVHNFSVFMQNTETVRKMLEEYSIGKQQLGYQLGSLFYYVGKNKYLTNI